MPGKETIASLLGRMDTTRVDPFAGITKYAQQMGDQIRADEKYAAEKAQKDLLFQQQQDERTRLLGERAATDAFHKAMSEDPTEKAGWITDAVASSKNAGLLSQGELYGDVNAYEAAAAQGAKVLPTLYADSEMQKALDPAEVAKRLAFQQHPVEMLKSVVGDELRGQQLSRALNDARQASKQYLPSYSTADDREQGYLSPALAQKAEDQKAAAITADAAERTRLQNLIADAEKNYQTLEGKGFEQLSKSYSLQSNVGEHSNVTKPLELSAAAQSEKWKDKNGRDLTSAEKILEVSKLVEGEVSPYMTGWMPWSDASDVRSAITNARKAGYDSKVIGTALLNSLDTAGGGNNLDAELFTNNLKEYQPDSNDGSSGGYRTGDTITDSKKNESRQVTYANSAEWLAKKRLETNDQKAEYQKELNKLDLSPTERQNIEMQDAVDKWLGMLTPAASKKVDAPAIAGGTSTPTPPTTVSTGGGKSAKILAAPIKIPNKEADGRGEKTPIVTTTPKGLEFTLTDGKKYSVPVSVGVDNRTTSTKLNPAALTEEEGMLLGSMLGVGAMGAGALAARGAVAVAPYVAAKLLPMYNKLAATAGGKKVLNLFGKNTPAQQETMKKLMEKQVGNKSILDTPTISRTGGTGPKLNIARPTNNTTTVSNTPKKIIEKQAASAKRAKDRLLEENDGMPSFGKRTTR